MAENKSTPRDRITFTIPDFDSFANLLHDRLDGLLYYIEDLPKIDTPSFMLITNLYVRATARIAARSKAQALSNAPGKNEMDIDALVLLGRLVTNLCWRKKPPFRHSGLLSSYLIPMRM